MNEGGYDAGAYSEHHHTGIETICLFPKRFHDRKTLFTLLANRPLTAEITDLKTLPGAVAGIGTLTFRGAQSNYLGSMPFDAALPIPGLILSGGYRFIYLAGQPLHRGSARIRYLSFYRDFDPDEL